MLGKQLCRIVQASSDLRSVKYEDAGPEDTEATAMTVNQRLPQAGC